MSDNTFSPGPTPSTVKSADGTVLTVPDGWALLPPGDAALTRRVKAAAVAVRVKAESCTNITSQNPCGLKNDRPKSPASSRVTQIMDLLMLAPDIQEALLFLPPIHRGRDPITERDVRRILAVLDWGKQKSGWNRD